MKIALLLLAAAVAYSQDAKVIQIEDGDAKAMDLAQAALAQAQQSVKQWEQHIQDKYLTVDENDPERGNTILGGDAAFSLSASGTVMAFDSTYHSNNGAILQIEGKCMGIVGDKLEVIPCEPVKAEPPDPCRLSRESSACLKQRLAEAIETEKNPPPKPHYKYRRAGWDNGFDFTKDYKFIVPKRPAPAPQPYNGIQLTPGFSPYVNVPTSAPSSGFVNCGVVCPGAVNSDCSCAPFHESLTTTAQ